MDKNWSCLAVAVNVYNDVQIQFLWSSSLWDAFAQEKHNFTSPALVIANHNFNNYISPLSHVSAQVPSGIRSVFKNLSSEIRVKQMRLGPFPFPFCPSFPLCPFFFIPCVLGKLHSCRIKVKRPGRLHVPVHTLYWFLFSTFPELKLTWNHHSTFLFLVSFFLFVVLVLWYVFAIFNFF